MLLYVISENMVLGEEFALLYDINTSRNGEFEYWTYNAFNLCEISDDDCVAEFRFKKNDIPKLVTAVQLPGEIHWGMYNDLKVNLVEALCVILKRLAFPCRYSDMMLRFARPVPQLSMIYNKTIHWLDSRWGFKLTNLNQQWLTPKNLTSFTNSIYQNGAARNNVRG